MAAGGAFSLTPQAQLTYARVDFEDVTDSFGAKVSADQGDSLWGWGSIMAGPMARAASTAW